MVSAVSGASSSIWALEKQSASSLANSIFATVDTENKGYIDKASLTSALSGSDTSSSDLDEVFAELDQDSDGKITRSELSSSIDQLSQALAAQFSQSRVDSARADSGKDPGFTKDELTAIASDSETDAKQSALMTKLAENFDAADTDSDGRINGEEAMAYDKLTSTDSTSGTAAASTTTQGGGGAAPAGGGGSSTSTTYAAADTNEDGTVSLQELVAYELKQDSPESSNSDNRTRNDEDAAKRILMQLVQAYGVSNNGNSSTVAETESLSAYA